jgi:hypothetical protein
MRSRGLSCQAPLRYSQPPGRALRRQRCQESSLVYLGWESRRSRIALPPATVLVGPLRGKQLSFASGPSHRTGRNIRFANERRRSSRRSAVHFELKGHSIINVGEAWMLSNECACLQTNAKKHLTCESQLRRQRALRERKELLVGVAAEHQHRAGAA